jgi:putative Mg2+ transporter-C (MgtC) family protein
MNELTIMLIRLLLAALLSGVIGIEREIKDQPAGLRTHILVGTTACMLMLLSLYGFEPYLKEHTQIDYARIPAYVISGLGFLGAGTIIVNQGNVKGLTTAASIWTVAGIGLVVGAGMYELGVIVTVIVIVSLSVLRKIAKVIERKWGE